MVLQCLVIKMFVGENSTLSCFVFQTFTIQYFEIFDDTYIM